MTPVKSPPEGLDGNELRDALASEWGFDADAAQYVPDGFGSYHWVVEDAAFERRFVTVDDLDAKRWLGAERDSTFSALKAAFDTAHALRERGGLDFVISPLPTQRGETLGRIDGRYSIALFPMIDGSAGEFGEHGELEVVSEIVGMLVELHAATAVVESVATRFAPEVVGRRRSGGRAGGPGRDLGRRSVLGGRAYLARRRGGADRAVAARVRRSRGGGRRVGERSRDHARRAALGQRHARASGAPLLVDWDTVGLAPPERDLWMVDDGSGDALELYAEATGRPVRQSAIDLYRLGWDLTEIAGYTSLLRGPHGATEDTEASAGFLAEYIRLLDRWDSFR